MLKWMIENGTIDGALTELNIEFVPSGVISPVPQHLQGGLVPVNGPIIEGPPSANMLHGQSGLVSATPSPALVESPGTNSLPSIGDVKAEIEEKRKEIDAAKRAYEKGEIGIDAYVSKSELLGSQLEFLKHRMVLIEHVQDPKGTCMSCLKPVEDGQSVVKCPNDHPFHMDCGQQWLSKHEECPWCQEKITSIDAMQDL